MENWLLYFIYFFFFYFGAIIGSFLNVFVFELEPNVLKTKKERMELGIKSFWERINRRSHCNSCGYKLEVLDLFPIFSYLVNLGKCRHCNSRYSIRYFLVEIFSALVIWGVFYKVFQGVFDFNFWLNFGFLTFIFSGLILIFLFDLKHKIIPDLILIPTGVLILIYLNVTQSFSWLVIWHSFLTELPFWKLWFLPHGKWIGFADWKLVFILTFFFESGEKIYSFLTLSVWYGAVFSIILMWFSKKYKMKSEIPFGPFLILGFWTVYLFNINVLALTARIINFLV